MFVWFVLLALANSSIAAPSINLPVNAQVPPVATAGQAYDFVFSESTFTSSAGPINYVLGDSPSWLALDSSSRTFHGTPGSNGMGPGEVQSFIVDLVATDRAGSSTMPITFVVTTHSGPKLGTPIAAQLPAFGAFSSPDTLLLTPGSALSLTFSPNTFTNTNVHTMYYAMCANNTPLPSWVNFDPSSLTFSGTIPQATSPSELPQSFGIQLAASEVTGFSQAVTSFHLVIGSHMFTFGNSLQIINATIGSSVNFTSLQDDLTLDGKPVQESDIRQVVSDAPSWLSLSSGTLALCGTIPANALQQNFTVTATDRFGDSASTVILVQIAGKSSVTLISPIAPLSATIGTNFTYALNASLLSTKGLNVTVDPGTASAWLEFDSRSMELYGHVPSNLKPQTVQFNVSASQGAQSQSQIVSINITCGNTECPPTDSDSGVPGTTDGGGSTSRAGGTANRSWIAAAVTLPLAATTGILILWWYSCARGGKLRLDFKSKKHQKTMIPRPIVREKDGSPNLQVGQLWGHSRHHERLLSEAPGSPKISHAQESTLRRISRLLVPNQATETAHRSQRPDSWESYIRKLEASGPNHSGAVPKFSRVPEEQTSQLEDITIDSTPTSRSTNNLPPARPIKSLSQHRKRTSKMNHSGFGMFSSRPTSGFGHGRSGPSQEGSSVFCANRGVGHGGGLTPQGPSGWGIVRNSWRNLSRLSWTSTQSSPNSHDPIVEEGVERPLTQKTFSSMLSSFRRPSTSNTLDVSTRPHIIHEASDDEELGTAVPRPFLSNPSKVKAKSSLRRKGHEALQDYHNYRVRQSSGNPWFSAHLSSSRKSSTKIGPNSPARPTHGNLPFEPITPPKPTLPRSQSQSSSLSPGRSLKSSPNHSSHLPSSSHTKPKPRLPHPFTTRTLSLHRSHSSYASTTTSSNPSNIITGAPLYPHGALLESTDSEGNKQWRHPNHPNPLGTNRTTATDAGNVTDISDAELIDSLRAAGQFGAGQRLSYLRAQTEGVAVEEPEVETAIEVRSARGRKLDHRSGLTRGGSLGGKSMEGEVGDVDAGESGAFV